MVKKTLKLVDPTDPASATFTLTRGSKPQPTGLSVRLDFQKA